MKAVAVKELKNRLSAYLREVALGHRPRTTADQEAVRRLVEANTHFGRVGGLLRMALKERGVDPAKVEAALDELQGARDRLSAEAVELIRSFRRGGAP